MATTVDSALESIDQISSVLSGITALITTSFAVLIWLLRVSPRVRGRLVTAHLRKPWFGAGRRAAKGLSPGAADRFRKTARMVAAGEPITAADGVERAIPPLLESDPWSGESLSLLSWCEFVDRPGRESLFARLVAPDQIARVRTYVASVVAYLEEFARLGLVPEDAASRDTTRFLGELSGAAILTDATRSRSGVASRVLVRHSTRYRGFEDADLGADTHAKETAWPRYADKHKARGRDAHCDGTQPGHGDRLGDYDGRLPDVRGVGVATSLIDGSVTFVLDTSETCYRVSEDAGHLGCKKLLTGEDARTRRFEPQASGWLTSNGGADERVSILTSYVSLIARGAPDATDVHGLRQDQAPREVLVLCRRSNATNNGQGTVSATAGGLVELGADGSVDANAHGAPDPLAAAIRECREEIGLVVDSRAINPVCVFTCTIQGRDDEVSDMATRAQGQLVSVVLSLASVPLTLAELRTARAQADQAVGGFEVDDLCGIAMYAGPDGCLDYARAVAELSPDLDQHGLLSCFYAAVRAYGLARSKAAFQSAFKKRPWWSQPWSGETGTPRLCRDPRAVRAVDGLGQTWKAARVPSLVTPTSRTPSAAGR